MLENKNLYMHCFGFHPSAKSRGLPADKVKSKLKNHIFINAGLPLIKENKHIKH